MTAINHAFTGAGIAIIFGNPVLAIPAAFLSHFVCDAFPHFGSILPDRVWLKSRRFKVTLVMDALLCFAFVVTLALFHVHHWYYVALAAFAATSPDFFWINHFITIRRGKKWSPNIFSRFAAGIQWFQRPIGALVEVAWATSAIVLLLTYYRG